MRLPSFYPLVSGIETSALYQLVVFSRHVMLRKKFFRTHRSLLHQQRSIVLLRHHLQRKNRFGGRAKVAHSSIILVCEAVRFATVPDDQREVELGDLARIEFLNLILGISDLSLPVLDLTLRV